MTCANELVTSLLAMIIDWKRIGAISLGQVCSLEPAPTREKWALCQPCQLPLRIWVLIGVCFLAPPRGPAVQGRWCWPALRGWGGSIWEREHFPRSYPDAFLKEGQDRLGPPVLGEVGTCSFYPHISKLGLTTWGWQVDFSNLSSNLWSIDSGCWVSWFE